MNDPSAPKSHVRTVRRLVGPLFLLLTVPSTVIAQTLPGASPGAVQERSHDTLRYYQLENAFPQEPRQEEELIEQLPESPEETVPSVESKFHLRALHITPSEILDSGELRDIAESYEGRDVTLSDLYELVNTINELYRRKNVLTAKAILPPQKIEEGIVEVRLIEGRLGILNVEGNRSTRAEFILDRISIQPEDILLLDTFQKDLARLNSFYNLNARAVLRPGREHGTSDIVIGIAEPPRLETVFFSDNAGRDDIGLYRGGIIFTDNSISHRRDKLTIGGIFAEGTANAFFNYTLPVNQFGTRVETGFEYSEIRIISGALEDLDVTGDARNVTLGVSHPLIVGPSTNLTGYAGMSQKKSTTDFSDVELFQTRVFSMKAGMDWQAMGEKSIWTTGQFLTGGMDAFGAEENFLKYNGSASIMRLFKHQIYALFRGGAQLSDTKGVPSSEQFQTGGVSTVRGYPEGFLLNDNGYFVSAELSLPLNFKPFHFRNSTTPIRAFVFADHGATFRFDDDSNHTSASGTGFGLMFDNLKAFSGRIQLAFPLEQRGAPDVDDAHVNFYLEYKL